MHSRLQNVASLSSILFKWSNVDSLNENYLKTQCIFFPLCFYEIRLRFQYVSSIRLFFTETECPLKLRFSNETRQKLKRNRTFSQSPLPILFDPLDNK